ncbi:MAG: site-specific DNA-methyltransferase [Veillonella sp.]|uniref:site-specific DNA-methyltransferase n=1 Tax=Veillonella sp. TaxID=1926307 RepID=UPI0025D62E15|nr:site-specific DNA-methyltransferase [Veillonella sp.]MBS5337091.1 site-specific DNA-methyltransferase [Veillonella sp.]
MEGGQDKEDQKRKEILYNEIIASDEISKMLAPKVFTKAKRYTKDSVEENITFEENDNLIIKGNNLIALSSLLKRYEGKIKCIFIDIPYNTGNDSFNYNDDFNQSTWCLFMKNRLEIACRLLKPNGSIAIYVDNNEIGYLQVLMDEIFGRENRGSLITVKRGSVTGHKAINPGVVNVIEYIMIYSKNKPQWNPNKVYKARGRNDRYNNFIKNREADIEKWEFISLQEAFSEYKGIPKNQLKKSLGTKYEDELYDFVKNNAESVIQFAYPDEEAVGQETRELIHLSKENPTKVYLQKREKELDIYLRKGQRLLFYSDRLMDIDGELVTGELVSDFWDDVLPNDLASEGTVTFKKGKKPEKAVKRVLEILTQSSDDIVLDFFMGSGTIPAVCQKMNRRYIGIEQMDYVEDISLKRLNAVIDGSDRKGVSKAVNWQGGGSFVYCELLENANSLIDKIQSATEDTIQNVKAEIYSDERIVPYITRAELEKADDEFALLSLDEKKKALIGLVDKNKLYVNFSDMNDESYEVCDSDKAFTKSFYAEV